MDTMTIFITQEDIDEGRPSVASSCMIARAIKRQMQGAKVGVGSATDITINGEPWRGVDGDQDRINELIQKFDTTRKPRGKHRPGLKPTTIKIEKSAYQSESIEQSLPFTCPGC